MILKTKQVHAKVLYNKHIWASLFPKVRNSRCPQSIAKHLTDFNPQTLMRLDRSFGIILKYPLIKKHVFPIVMLLVCLSFTEQNDVCAEFVFISICCSLVWRNVPEWDLLTSQLVWKSILIHYAAFTNVMYKVEISCAHTLKWTFQWAQRHLVSSSSTFELERYIVYICIFKDSGFFIKGQVDVWHVGHTSSLHILSKMLWNTQSDPEPEHTRWTMK